MSLEEEVEVILEFLLNRGIIQNEYYTRASDADDRSAAAV